MKKVHVGKQLMIVNSVSSALTHVLNISVLLWLYQYLLKNISPEEFSIYPVVVSVMVFVPLLTTVLTAGLNRFMIEAFTEGDETRVRQIVSTIFPVLLAAGIAVLILGWTFSWYIDHFLKIPAHRLWDARLMMGLMMFSAALRLPLVPFGMGPYVRQNFVLLNLIRVCSALLRIALLFILLFGVSTRVLWVVVATVTANVTALLATQIISQYMVPILRFRPRDIQWHLLRRIMTFSTWSFMTQLSYRIRQSADVIILNILATPIDVNSFHVGSLCRRQMDQGLDALYGPLYPALTALYTEKGKGMVREVYLRGGRYALWGVLFVALPLIVYASEVVELYVGSLYSDAFVVMMLTLGTYPLGLGSSMIWKLCYATDNLKPAAWRAICTQAVTLTFTFYLVGALKMGAIGSAVSHFCVTTLSLILLIWPLGLKIADVNFLTWAKETLAPGLAPGAVSIIIWTMLKALVAPDTWTAVGLCAAAGCILYIAVLFCFCLQDKDRSDLNKGLSTIRNRFGLGKPEHD